MKQAYIEPELEVICLETADVITTNDGLSDLGLPYGTGNQLDMCGETGECTPRLTKEVSKERGQPL